LQGTTEEGEEEKGLDGVYSHYCVLFLPDQKSREGRPSPGTARWGRDRGGSGRGTRDYECRPMEPGFVLCDADWISMTEVDF
jgi:hypothetical protein